MKENNLTVARNEKLRAKRKITTSKPKPTRPNQWWGIDMTKVMTEAGWVYIVIVIDWHTKKVVGHYAGTQSKASHWMIALNRAVNTQFPHGIRGHNLSLMSDNGCQPTSIAFMKDCGMLGIKQAFTSYNNPKGNADTERFMRTLKEEFAWLREWKTPFTFSKELDEWVNYYNTQYLHSTLGYKTPNMFEGMFFQKQQQNALLNFAC